MAAAEAMRLYVRTLEEENAVWLTDELIARFEAQRGPLGTEDKSQDENGREEEIETTPNEENTIASENGKIQDSPKINDAPKGPFASDGGSKVAETNFRSRSVAEVVVEGSWVSPYIASERRPPPRYEQSLALAGNIIYMVGGSTAGRHLGDAWALNLEDLTWQQITKGGTSAPALAGHAVVPWNGNLLVFGGRTKMPAKGKPIEETMPVRVLDTNQGTWSSLETKGLLSDAVADADTKKASQPTIPGPRGAHTATLINGKVYIFGGEDAKRRPLSELWILDLATLEWDRPTTTGTQPAPRSGHSACAFQNRYIFVFGGGTVANCFDDLNVFDTQTLEWLVAEVEGPAPPPRAGHAAAILGSTLYIVGGGNNTRGCADMYSLDLSNFDTGHMIWNLVGNTPAEAAIASEGLSLVTVPMAGCMVSFGGYNGKYHNAIHVYRPEGFIVVRPGKMGNAAGFGEDKEEESLSNIPSDESEGDDENEQEKALIDQRKASISSRESTALELSLMRRQLDSATSALAVAENMAAEAREALLQEQQKSMQLEVEVAGLKKKLLAMNDLERELARRQKMENRNGGLWSFISGADAADNH